MSVLKTAFYNGQQRKPFLREMLGLYGENDLNLDAIRGFLLIIGPDFDGYLSELPKGLERASSHLRDAEVDWLQSDWGPVFWTPCFWVACVWARTCICWPQAW